MAVRIRSSDDCIPMTVLCITRNCDSRRDIRLDFDRLALRLSLTLEDKERTHSKAPFGNGATFFLSGFSKMHWVPLNWHLRHGALRENKSKKRQNKCQSNEQIRSKWEKVVCGPGPADPRTTKAGGERYKKERNAKKGMKSRP